MKKNGFTPLEILLAIKNRVVVFSNGVRFVKKKDGHSLTGFTVVELLVVVFIIGILASIGFVNYKEVKGKLALNRAAHQVLQDIRKIQEMAMSSGSYSSGDCSYSFPPPPGGGFEAWCITMELGAGWVKFRIDVQPTGQYHYAWSGFGSGCADDHICIKNIGSAQPPYIANVSVTDNVGNIVMGNCTSATTQGVELVYGSVDERIFNYGIYFDTALSNTSYKSYLDVDGPYAVDGVGYGIRDCNMETINIAESGVIIKGIYYVDLDTNTRTSVPSTGIGFASPNPDVNISGFGVGQDSVEIVLALASDPDNTAKQRTISINKAGLLELK